MKIFTVYKAGKAKAGVGYLLIENKALSGKAYILKRLETKDYVDDVPLRTLIARELLKGR